MLGTETQAAMSSWRSRSRSRSRQLQRKISSIVEESINRDLQDEDVNTSIQETEAENALSRSATQELGQHSLVGSYRNASYMATGPRSALDFQQQQLVTSPEQGREDAIADEASLLRDNNLIPPKHARRRESQASTKSRSGSGRKISIPGFSIPRQRTQDEESGPAPKATGPSETTALLEDSDESLPPDDPAAIDKTFENAVVSGDIITTWQRETKTLAAYSGPLIVTFVLQTSLTLTSVFTVGHIGKNELGAVSLGSMTANITGYAVYHGLATSLDTLCAQAYGSGRKKLVGLNLQRAVYFLWAITIPISVLWFFGSEILKRIVPEKEIAELAGLYLKILILGAPGYACFESAKRFVQAQGKFAANMYVLFIAAPLNVLMHWLFVWVFTFFPTVLFSSSLTRSMQRFGWGFIGCPIAVVITETLMPILLMIYVMKTDAYECWPGFTRAAFRNWGPMIRLALPGLVMIMAEFLAFEILTLASANFSATHLAANTVLQSLSILTYQLPWPISVAGSTRVANLVGAGLPEAAKCTAKVMLVVGSVIGVFNMLALSLFRDYIPWLYTNDAEVVALAARTLPVNAAFQLWDSLAAQCNGIMRGIGKQGVGGIISLVAFYGVSRFSAGHA